MMTKRAARTPIPRRRRRARWTLASAIVGCSLAGTSAERAGNAMPFLYRPPAAAASGSTGAPPPATDSPPNAASSPAPPATPPAPPPPSDATAREKKQGPGAYAHDGFYLSVGIGIGFLRNGALAAEMIHVQSAGKLEANGTGLAVTGSIGWAVTRNLILFGRLDLYEARARYVDSNGFGMDDVDTEAGLIGGGLAYYLENSNVFFAGSVGRATFHLGRSGLFGSNQPGTVYHLETKDGFGAALEVGKEWWVSPSWGLGAALKGSYGSTKELSVGNTWTSLGLGLMFSATFN